MDPASPRPLPALRTCWPVALACLVLVVLAGPAGSAAALPAGRQPSEPIALTPRLYFPFAPNNSPSVVPPQPALAGMRASDFGLVWVNSAEEPRGAARIARGAATGARLDRLPIYWNLIETGPGQFTWAGQDTALAANESYGLDTLAILLGEPGFYASGWGAFGVGTPQLPPVGGSFLRSQARPGLAPVACGPGAPRGLNEPVFSDGSDRLGPGKTVNPHNPWARFVDEAVQRYRPGGTRGLHVRTWEVWNEPDLCQFWGGTAAEYARLLKVAYLAIKNRDPQAVVVWGGLATYQQPNFLYDLINTLHGDALAAEYGGFFDAAAAHHYAIVQNGMDWTARMRAALDAVGWHAKPIWVTESGVPVCNDYPGPSCPSPWRASPEEQASYIWQNVAYTRLAGGGPIFHFMLHDDCGNVIAPNSPDGFGLVKNETTTYCSPAHAEPRLAYTAFKLAVQYFAGADVLWADTQQDPAGSYRRVAFYDPANHERRLLIFALGEAAVTGHVPAVSGQARRIDLDGSEVILTPTNGEYQLTLPGATNRNSPNSQGSYDIGIYGRPYLLVEQYTLPSTVANAAASQATQAATRTAD